MPVGNTAQGIDYSGTSATTIATSSSIAISAESWAVAWVYYFAGATTITVSDGTNTFAEIPAGSPINDGSSRLATHARYYASGGTFTFTATYGASVPYRSIVVVEVTGRDSAALIAAQCAGQVQPTPGTGTDAVSTGNATPQSASSEIIAYSMSDTGIAAPAVGTGFTNVGTFLNFGGVDLARVERRTLASTSPIAATFTATANNPHFSSQIIFSEAPPSGPPPTRIIRTQRLLRA